MNNFNNNNFMDSLPISKTQLRIFLCSGLAMFIMMCLQNLGIHSPVNAMKLISPMAKEAPKEDTSVMKIIKPKLEEKKNNFQLKNPTNPLVAQVEAASPMDKAAGYAVVDLDTGEVIAAKDGNKSLPIASITKVMSAVVALDLAKPEEIFTIQKQAAEVIPTKVGIVPGEKMTLDDLLHGMLLVSGNDTAEAVRDSIDAKYGQPVFIQAMNAKAKFLGLQNTSYANPQGFDDPNNYSSVEDLAILTAYALNNYPEIAKIASQDYHYVPANENHKQFDMYNWNGLLDVYPQAQGLKIGNTDDAGYTTIVTSTRGGKRLAAIVLGAPRILDRDMWAAQLLDLGYQQTLGLPPVNVTEKQLHAKYNTWKYWN